MTATIELSPRELMAIAIARKLPAGRAIVGAAGALPVAALLLAKLGYGRDIQWVCSGTGFVNPSPRRLYPSTTQFEYLEGATSVLPYEEVAILFEKGFDMCFFGGLEIDSQGAVNLNVTSTGAMGPGPAGLPVGMARAKNCFLFVSRHHRKGLVETVRFVTGRPHGNIRGLFTPLAEFDLGAGTPRLVNLLSGNLTEIEEATGFGFDRADGLKRLEPTLEEVKLLREIDSDGFLRV
jgi:acyl CoA:acetate/3-ketoacid CoA transferase beta subunit